MEENGVMYYQSVGRRKRAIARVKLCVGKGTITANREELSVYFPGENLVRIAQKPLKITNCIGKYDIKAILNGGGYSGQAGALSLGISRALMKIDISLRPLLKKAGLVTRDPREKERKKYGQKGARKRFQFSKR